MLACMQYAVCTTNTALQGDPNKIRLRAIILYA